MASTGERETAVEFLQSMLEDLAASKEPLLRYAGKGFGYAYWSNTMRRIEATWVHVPPTYDPAKSYQLFIYYKCGGGISNKDGKAAGGYRPDVAVANQTDPSMPGGSWTSRSRAGTEARSSWRSFPRP